MNKTEVTCNGCHQKAEAALHSAEIPDPEMRHTLWVRPPRGWWVTTAFLNPGTRVGNSRTGEEGEVEHGMTINILVCDRCMALGRLVKIPEESQN